MPQGASAGATNATSSSHPHRTNTSDTLEQKEKTQNMTLKNGRLGGIAACNTNYSSPKAHFLCLLSGGSM